MKAPLVTVICLCYNHERFVAEAVQSVLSQSYKNIQIVIVDDHSSDQSRKVIDEIVSKHSQIAFLPLPENIGNCRAFNRGLALAQGDYVVDFATDDVFAEDRIEKQVAFFEKLDDDYGVVFTDAYYIDENGNRFRQHFPYLLQKGLLTGIPQGDVYSDILSRYFIAAPTMLVRRSVFDAIGGYDETLAYEDFDFWIRSSRLFKFALINEPLTFIRKVKGSLSSKAYTKGDEQLRSTYRVCLKARELNRTPEEDRALVIRARYEMRQSVMSGNFEEARKFYELMCSLERPPLSYQGLDLLARLRMPLGWLQKAYRKIGFPDT